MINLFDSFQLALSSIRAHAFRSFLTSLGIIIGVASVIAVVSIVQGLSYSVSENFKGLGSNSLTVSADTSFEEAMQGKQNRLTILDYREIQQHIDDIDNMTPMFSPFGQFGAAVRYGSKSAFTHVTAVSPTYQDTYQIYPQIGRFMTNSDELSRRKVCVIGTKLRDNLNLPANPLGLFIEVGGEWVKIIGVAESRGEMFGISQDDYVLMPFSVGLSLSGNNEKQDISITFNVKQLDHLEEIQDRISTLLRQLHHLKPGQRNDFNVQTAKQLSESFSKIVDSVTLVLGGVVSISLLVGGIGIMNIMLVSVTERTREIGICKALGAQRHQILMQFLIEATTLSMLGGLVGLFVGAGLSLIASKMIPNFPAPEIPWWSVFLAFGFSSLVGVIFGIIPAAKAANLNPIDSLRYE